MNSQQFATQSADLRVHADDARLETLHGRDHVVAEATLVREMVLKGQLLPFDEIQRTAMAWNGSPVTIAHPRDEDGGFLPASQAAEAFETHSVGQLFNVDADPDRRALVGEVWLDVERSANSANALDRDDPAALLQADEGPIEVSTGYWYRQQAANGEYDGEEYDAVQMDVQPDHLATLPNSVGECSIGDGCGLARADDTAAAAAAANTADTRRLVDSIQAGLSRLAGLATTDGGDVTDTAALACQCDDDADGCSCGCADSDADVAGNQDVGDAVRWESDAGGSVEGWRYGVVVDGLQDEDGDDILVAVYEPGDDGWTARGEQNPMNPDRLEVVGSDGVESLPAIDQIGGNTDADTDGQSTTSRVVATTTNHGFMAYNLNELSEASGLSVEALENMDDDELENLAGTVMDDGSDDGDTDGTGDDTPDDDGDTDTDDSQANQELLDRIEELEAQVDEQKVGASRDELKETINTHADFSEDALAAMSTSDLSELAESVKPNGGVYAGRSGARTTNDDEDAPETGASLDALGGDA